MAGGFEPVRDFEASKSGRFVQSKDKASGLPLCAVEVIDGDASARDKTARDKVAAADQPSLPAASPGTPFAAVEFTGLTITPYVSQAGRLAYSLKATGVRARTGRRHRTARCRARRRPSRPHSPRTPARAAQCSAIRRYTGTRSDVAVHAAAAHAAGVPLVVDAAWPAHFGFSPGGAA